MNITLYEQVDNLFKYSKSGVTRIGTGIKPIDDRIRGVAPGEICMVLGRSYAGKSVMAQNIIANNWDVPSIFFSMEMPYVQALSRLYSMDANVNAENVMDMIEAGNPPDAMWELVLKYTKHALVEEPSLSFGDMSFYIKRYEEGFGERPAFVVIDYLELINGAKKSGEGLTAVDRVATHLKDWSKQEKMRVFVLHQCNKQEPKWLPPTENSPRYGGYTEADFVIGMWKPAFDPDLGFHEKWAIRDDVNLNIIKNRPFGQDAELIRTTLTESLRLEAY